MRHPGPRWAALLGVALLLLPLSARAQTAAGQLAGTVSSAAGRPLADATVRVEGTTLRARTGPDGAYRLTGVPAGRRSVVVERLGYDTGTAQLTLGAGASVRLDFSLRSTALALEPLTITAQKRTQQLREVPIPLTAYEGEFLENVGVQEFDALSAYVPGLEVQLQSPNNPGFVIRGITSDDGDSRVEPRVSVFQDGVSISKSRGSVVELFDLERVEVLKGPQGTLFGRGAQIGAVHLIQNKPTAVRAGELTSGVGNYGGRFVSGFVNAPLAPGRLFVRVAGTYNARDGYVENRSGGDLNGKETVAVRGSLRWLPSDRSSLTLIANYQQDTPPGTSFKSGVFAPAGGDSLPSSPAALGGDPRFEDLFIDRTVAGATLLADRQLGAGWTLSSVSAYRRFDSYESFDADGTIAPALQFGEDAEGDQLSQELRLSFDQGGRFAGFVGAAAFRETGSQRVPFRTDERVLWGLFTRLLNARTGGGFPAFPFMRGGVPVVYDSVPGALRANPQTAPLAGAPLNPFHEEESANFGETSAFELFADGTVALAERLKVTAGIRGTYEDVTAGYQAEASRQPSLLGAMTGNGPNILFRPTEGRREHADTFLSAVGRVVVSYDARRAGSWFAGVSRGRRPNVIHVGADTSFVLADETVWSYEVGTKGVTLGPVEVDANAFAYDYSHFQTDLVEFDESGRFTVRTEDSGSASALGFETAIRGRLSGNATLFANYGFIDAGFDDRDAEGNEQRFAGNTFRLTPKHSLSVGGGLTTAASRYGSAFFRPTYTWKSRVFFEEAEARKGTALVQEAYGLVNLRGGWVAPSGRYELSAWINNALDEEFIIDAGNTGRAFGAPTFIAGPPRLFGIHLSARF